MVKLEGLVVLSNASNGEGKCKGVYVPLPVATEITQRNELKLLGMGHAMGKPQERPHQNTHRAWPTACARFRPGGRSATCCFPGEARKSRCWTLTDKKRQGGTAVRFGTNGAPIASAGRSCHVILLS